MTSGDRPAGSFASPTASRCSPSSTASSHRAPAPTPARARFAIGGSAAGGGSLSRLFPLRVKLGSHGSLMARPVYLQQRTYLMRIATAVECHRRRDQ